MVPERQDMTLRPRIPTRPEKLREIQDRWRATWEGSEPGRWSARKSGLAVREYMDKGGRWTYPDEEEGAA